MTGEVTAGSAFKRTAVWCEAAGSAVNITLERITERRSPSRVVRKPHVTGRAVDAL